MAKFREVFEHPEFTRDKKQLTKRFRTLEEDLEKLIDYSICLRHKQGIDNGGIVQIPGLGFEHPPVYKVKKFACKSLKGKGAQSGLRPIYAYFKDDDRIELVEIYYKEKQGSDCNMKHIKKLYQ